MKSREALPDKVAELLAGEATDDLTATERAELARALPAIGDRDALMRVAALAQLAFLGAERAGPRPLRSTVESDLERAAARWLAARGKV